MSKPLTSALAVPMLSALLLAQTGAPKQISGSFFPRDYRHEWFVDIDGLQDTEVWSAIERSLFAGMMFQRFRKEFGCRLRDLETVRSAKRTEKDAKGRERSRSVTLFRSTRPMRLPKESEVEERSWGHVRKRMRIAGFDVLAESGYEEPGFELTRDNASSLFVVPKPDRLVVGDADLVASVLLGKRRGGVPHPDLLAMSAGPRPLAYIAGSIEELGFSTFDESWLTKDDQVRYAMVRLFVDPKTEDTSITLTVRFANGKTGPAKMRDGMKTQIAKLLEDRRFALAKPLLKKVVLATERNDLVAKLDVGGAGDVGALLTGSFAMPFFMIFDNLKAGDVQVEIGEIEVEDAAEEVEEAKKGAAEKPKSKSGKRAKAGAGKTATSRPAKK